MYIPSPLHQEPPLVSDFCFQRYYTLAEKKINVKPLASMSKNSLNSLRPRKFNLRGRNLQPITITSLKQIKNGLTNNDLAILSDQLTSSQCVD